MERAILEMGQSALKGTEHLHEDWEFQREYPLSRQLLALSHAWQMHSGDGSVAAKGAPEAILDLCHMPHGQQELVMKQVLDMANDGLRVLGVARAPSDSANLPDNQHDFDFTFIGLIGLADPIRPTVPAAIAQCRRAGVRVVMITGDYPGTAQSIAREIGLQHPDLIVTGPELEAMSEEEVSRKIHDVSVFARMVPEQKLRLVQALKANGEIVAMTGDGVNDAPALKTLTLVSPWANGEPTSPASLPPSSCSKTISTASSRQYAWAAASSTTSARPWATSWLSTSRSLVCA